MFNLRSVSDNSQHNHSKARLIQLVPFSQFITYTVPNKATFNQCKKPEFAISTCIKLRSSSTLNLFLPAGAGVNCSMGRTATLNLQTSRTLEWHMKNKTPTECSKGMKKFTVKRKLRKIFETRLLYCLSFCLHAKLFIGQFFLKTLLDGR